MILGIEDEIQRLEVLKALMKANESMTKKAINIIDDLISAAYDKIKLTMEDE